MSYLVGQRMSALRIIKTSFGLCKRQYKQFAVFSSMALVLFLLFANIGGVSSLTTNINMSVSFSVSSFIYSLFSLFIMSCIMLIAAADIKQSPLSFQSVILKSWQRIVWVILGGLVMACIIAVVAAAIFYADLGLFHSLSIVKFIFMHPILYFLTECIVILAVITYFILPVYFIAPITMTDGINNPFKALMIAYKLSHKNRFLMLRTYLTLFIAFFVVMLVMAYAEVHVLVHVISPANGWLYSSPILFVVFYIFMPVFYCSYVILYYNLKSCRKLAVPAEA